ncbi:copper resistance CopC family protein [Leifsonia sp. NCR5]|uniref:copper resistance CopC family protein n=1 Tax=Leifsonia sp. NCR5 TaxID=1978342 RepID=UPI0015C45193|nr:copper resistance CopC family protein [Leifsonia sp. NCR5]
MTTPPDARRTPRVRWRLLAFLAVVGAAFIANIVTAAAAEAHDALASANPGQSATVSTRLEEVTLTFNEAPLSGLQSGIIIQVTDASGKEVSTGDLRISDRTLARSLTITAQGDYTVTWRTVSADGHPIDGAYTFTYAGPVPPSPTPTATPTAVAPTATPSPSVTSAKPFAEASTASAPTGLIATIVIAVLVVAGVVLWAVIASSRRRSGNR